jgi:site-specific DNA-cytosine methylase
MSQISCCSFMRLEPEVPPTCQATTAQQYVANNFWPDAFYTNALVQRKMAVPITLYCAGFPCQAFSSLSVESLGLLDPRAQPSFPQ